MAVFYADEDLVIQTEELGDTWQLDGIVIGNGHNNVIMQLPAGVVRLNDISVFEPSLIELEAWMKQSDDPIAPLYKDGDSSVIKAVVRKSTRQLDQAIVWACYARDNYTCCYCGATGVPLTYDHYLAQAFGGQTTLLNGRTSCRPCNKKKGHMTIAAWAAYCAQNGLNDGSTITASYTVT